VVAQLEDNIPAAARAALGLRHLRRAEAAPFRNRFKLSRYWEEEFGDSVIGSSGY